MIAVRGYTPNPENTAWKFRREGHQGSNKDPKQHAERVVFGSLPKSVSAYLLVQSAFPCAICHGHFVTRTPQIIYYRGGAAKYVGILSGGNDQPPAGFAAHPDFEDLD